MCSSYDRITWLRWYIGVALSKNKIESLNGHSFPTIWLMNLILSYSIDLTSLYNQLLYFNWLRNLLGWQNQLIICTVIKVTPRKSGTILDQISLGSPNLVQSKIRLLAIPLRQQFKIAINLAIWECCKQHLIKKCHIFLTDACISNRSHANVMHMLYFLYIQTAYDSLLPWQNGFSCDTLAMHAR